MDEKQKSFVEDVRKLMLSSTDMTEKEAYSFANNVLENRLWLVRKLTEIIYEDANGEWHDKDW